MKILSFYISIIASLFFFTPAFAYLDPGTGSIILQAILAFLAASIATISFYWQKFKLLFIKIFKKDTSKKKIN
jgi:uncharacterized membrane protein